MKTKLAISGSYAGIERLIKDFYKYNTVCIVDFEAGTVTNANGIISGVRFYKKGKRWIFETTE